MKPAPTQRQKLEAAAGLLFGDRWQRQLARFLHRDERLIRRWAAGDQPVPAWVWQALLVGLERRQAEIKRLLQECAQRDEDAKRFAEQQEMGA